MTYIIVTLLCAVATALVLSLHRFSAAAESRKTPIYTDIAREYRRWLGRQTPTAVRSLRGRAEAGASRWAPALRNLELRPWLHLAFYASFLYLAVSGFVFAVFVPRGLHGYPLLAHVTAGGIFAVSLTAIVLLRGREYTAAPASRAPSPAALAFDSRRWTITVAGARNTAFWLFVLAGGLLIASAAAPMFPYVRTAGQRLFFDIHRYAALLSVLSAAVFVDLDLYGRRGV